MSKNLLILLEDNTNAEALIEQSKTIVDTQYLKASTGAFIDGISHNGIDKLFLNENHELENLEYSEIIEKVMRDNPLNDDKIVDSIIDKCTELNLKIDVIFNQDIINSNSFEHKSKYNDLFIIGKEAIEKNFKTEDGISKIENLLIDSKCPLLILPSKKFDLKNIILLFDGTAESFEAIKLFTYLISNQTKNANVQLIIKTTPEATKEERLLINYIKTYRLNFSVTRIDPDYYEEELFNMLNQFDNFLLVAGSNRNDVISDLLKKEESYFMQGNRSVFMI
jgi:hypothetical protein